MSTQKKKNLDNDIIYLTIFSKISYKKRDEAGEEHQWQSRGVWSHFNDGGACVGNEKREKGFGNEKVCL